MERQLSLIDPTLWSSPFCASGGRKSKGRSMILDVLKTLTREEVAREVRCTPEFVSMVASGKRIPSRWRLVSRLYAKFKIPPEAWEEHGSILAETISDKQRRLEEYERYERVRIKELRIELEEHEERLGLIANEKQQLVANIG